MGQQTVHTREGNKSISLNSGYLYREVQYNTEIDKLSQTVKLIYPGKQNLQIGFSTFP